MSEQEEAILERALSFPAKARAALAEKLLASLDQPDPAIDKLWANEAEDRIKAYEAGEMKGISATEIVKKYQKS